MNRDLVDPLKLAVLRFLFHYERQCHEFSDYLQQGREPQDCIMLDNIAEVPTALHGRLLLVPHQSLALPVHVPARESVVAPEIFTECGLYDHLLHRSFDATKVNLMLHVLAKTGDGVSSSVHDLGGLLAHPTRNPFPAQDLEGLVNEMIQAENISKSSGSDTTSPSENSTADNDEEEEDDDDDVVMQPASPLWDDDEEEEDDDDEDWEEPVTKESIQQTRGEAASDMAIWEQADSVPAEEVAAFEKETAAFEKWKEGVRRKDRVREARRAAPKKPPPKRAKLADLTPQQQARVRRGELVLGPAFTMDGMIRATPLPKKMCINRETFDRRLVHPAPIDDDADNGKRPTRRRRRQE